jgi:hypothetical protein
MLRGALADPDFKGQFSGHETFPLRHLWLRKAYDAVKNAGQVPAPRALFGEDDAIVRFGVGKNMVSSIRHWALACEIITEDEGGYRATGLGDFLFDDNGVDPFMESPATTWLVQWLVAGRPERTTTWYWVFNHFPGQTFDREGIAKGILDFCKERKRQRTSAATIKGDVQCFIRSYVPRDESKFTDDVIEPVLGELGLVKPIGSKAYEFRRGPKPSLPDGVFNYALHEFWGRYAPDQGTLAVEAVAFEPGSPGRVFKLDEHSLVERLARIEESSRGVYLWSDTAGVRSISRRESRIDPFRLLAAAYQPRTRRRAA